LFNDFLGHTTAPMTPDTYGHLMRDDLTEVANALENVIQAAQGEPTLSVLLPPFYGLLGHLTWGRWRDNDSHDGFERSLTYGGMLSARETSIAGRRPCVLIAMNTM
jgi:hypothetical protein